MMLDHAVRRPFTLLHNDMLQCAAGQFFCEDEDTSATSAEGDDECVFRDDTLVLLEMTTRDMMEVCRDITVRGTASWWYAASHNNFSRLH